MRPRAIPSVVAVLALAVLAPLAPTAAAHPAEPSAEPHVRLLHDWNDDWGGHAVLNDGHDLIALDVREAHDEALGNVLVFRLIMNGGYNGDAAKPELKEVLSFKAGTATVTREFRTADNVAFTGTFDAVRMSTPVLDDEGQPDSTRFAVEGLVRYASVGLAAGSKISQFLVQGHAGAAKADHMVGGYTENGVTVDQKPPTEAAQPAEYVKSEYAMLGPVQYADLAVDTPSLDLVQGGEAGTVTLTVTNLLSVDQVVTLHALSPSGVGTEFHPGAEVELPKDGEVTVHLYLTPGSSAASGVATVALMTDQGGHVVKTVEVAVAEPPADPAADVDTGPTGDAGPMDSGEPPLDVGTGDADASGEGAPAGETGLLPAPGVGLGLLVLVGWAAARRRRT